MGNAFRQCEALLQRQFSPSLVTVSGEVAKAAPQIELLARVLFYLFITGIVVVIGGGWVATALRMPKLQQAHKTLKEYQFIVLLVLYLGNMVGTKLTATGAFEVYVQRGSEEKKMIFSKLETGRMPDINYLVREIANVVGTKEQIRRVMTPAIETSDEEVIDGDHLDDDIIDEHEL